MFDFIKLLEPVEFIYKWRKDKKNQRIELLTAGLDLTKCDWKKDESKSNVYWIDRSGSKPSPIFEFSFLNHFPKPVVLLKIELCICFFPPRLSGIGQPPVLEVKPFAQYSFTLHPNKEHQIFDLPKPVEIAPQRATSFQLEFLLPDKQPLIHRYGLWYTLHFNDKKKIKVPVILLNSDNETGRRRITILS